MADVKISINLQNRSLTLEGSQDNLKGYLSADSPVSALLQRVSENPDSTTPDGKTEPHEAAIDHAWEWFSLHAEQRMQAVNFYLIAAAFISNAFVNALKDTNFVVAAGVGIMGAFIAFIFLMLEQRVRSLVKAGEGALISGEKQLAKDSQIPEIEILTRVEIPAKWTWSYSKVIRYLYGLTGLGFFAGFIYALVRSLRDRPLAVDYAISVGCISGLAMLVAGCYTLRLSRINKVEANMKTNFMIIYLLVGSLCMLSGIGMLLYCFYHAITRA